MRLVLKLVKRLLRHIMCIWNLAPVLLLLEIWALVRVLVICILVAIIVLNSAWEGAINYVMTLP
jgi:hypothetical protein